MGHKPALAAAVLALATASPAVAQDADHPCVREAAKYLPVEKFAVSLDGPKAEIIEYADQKLMAYKFTLVLKPKGDLALLVGPKKFECHTSEDRRRVLQFRER